MAEGILGLGSSGSTGLSQELIDKLKSAEAKAKVEPYDTELETWDKELAKIEEIDILTQELLSTITDFDLFTSGTNAFDQVSATTTGSSAVFDAVDVSSLTEGAHTVEVTQLAQRDVYQTDTFTDKEVQIVGGDDTGDKLSITVADSTYDFSTVGKTYEEIAEEINEYEELTASVEQVSDTEFRLIIKSSQSGTENELTVSQTGVDLGFGAMNSSSIDDFNDMMGFGRLTINGEEVIADTEDMSYNELVTEINSYTDSNGDSLFTASIDGDSIKIVANDGSSLSIDEDGSNGLSFTNSSHLMEAQNMKASVDGVDYDVSSSTITIEGNLTITAIELGTSTISLQKDTSSILTSLETFVEKYNELVTLVDDEIYSDDSSLSDSSSIKMIMSSIKDTLFGSYGDDSDQNIFSYGFSIDSSGHLSIDSDIFSDALADNLDDLKTLFVGVAEEEGLATVLKSYLDDLDSYDGILTLYGDSMVERKTTLEEEQETAQEELDSKYSLMSAQFAAYTAIITQMETSFAGMQAIIDSDE